MTVPSLFCTDVCWNQVLAEESWWQHSHLRTGDFAAEGRDARHDGGIVSRQTLEPLSLSIEVTTRLAFFRVFFVSFLATLLSLVHASGIALGFIGNLRFPTHVENGPNKQHSPTKVRAKHGHKTPYVHLMLCLRRTNE